MTFFASKRIARLIPALAVLMLVIGGATPARADGCGDELGACYGRAAAISGWWASVSYSMDCEVSYASCVRDLLEG
jgi:hypothetical protein